MKCILGLAVILAAATAVCHSSVINNKAARADLIVGNVNTGDRLLFKNNIYRPAVENTVQSEVVIWLGNGTNRITSVQATEVGSMQYASAWIISGGVGWGNVRIRFQSYRGHGYNYILDIWGR